MDRIFKKKSWFVRCKNWFRRYFRIEVLHVIEILGIAISAFFILRQLKENANQNKVSMRGQLYASEGEYEKDAREDDILNAVWVKVPVEVRDTNYSYALLSVLTSDDEILKVKNVKDLYYYIWSYESMSDSTRRSKTKELRKVFLYTQSVLYLVHNAYDYTADGILNSIEWKTWKGSIRELSANPIFLCTIWQGYRYNYFSKKFAEFLQEELCSLTPEGLTSKYDSLVYFRDREFIGIFYPEMLKESWTQSMPDY